MWDRFSVSLKLIHMGPLNNKPTKGSDNGLVYTCIYVSIGLIGLNDLPLDKMTTIT